MTDAEVIKTMLQRASLTFKESHHGFHSVEIAPYQWARRLDWSWYYGWDCASGVLWRPRNAAVAIIRKLPTKPKREAVSV